MARYDRVPRDDPAEELALQLKELLEDSGIVRLKGEKRERRLRQRREELVIGQIRRGLTWPQLAYVLGESEAQVRETYEAIVRQTFHTTRLTRRGPAPVRATTVRVFQSREDPTTVTALVDPKFGERPAPTDEWVEQTAFVGVLSADGEELLEVLVKRLGLHRRLRPLDLERAIRTVGALQQALGVQHDWVTTHECFLREPFGEDDLSLIVEAVYDVFGNDAGDHQAQEFGFGVSGGRR